MQSAPIHQYLNPIPNSIYHNRVLFLFGVDFCLCFVEPAWRLWKGHSERYFPNFPNFHVPKFGNGQAPQGRCLSISNFCKVGKLGKHAPVVAIPLGSQPCLWCTPRETRMIGRLKLCVGWGFLIASGKNSGLLDGTETPGWQCARQSQRCGNDPAAGGEETAITRERLCLDDHSD